MRTNLCDVMKHNSLLLVQIGEVFFFSLLLDFFNDMNAINADGNDGSFLKNRAIYLSSGSIARLA